MNCKTSSELSIIKGYLFRSRPTDHNLLLESGTETKFSNRKTEEVRFTLAFIVKGVMPKWADNLRATTA